MTIDPNTLNTLTSITLNVASNGLTSLLIFSGHKIKELAIGKDFLEQQELDKTALSPILQQAIQDAAEHAPWNAPKGVEIASLFLLSPEAEELVRQIYAMGIGSIEKPNDLTSIRTSFVELLKHYADAYRPDLLPDTQQFILAATSLFDALIQACNFLLSQAIDKGVLAAHEAKDSFRYNIISSQLTAIQKELELLQSSKEIDVKAILDFEKQYRKQVEYHCSRITPPNLQGARKHPIDSLYVSPSVDIDNRLFASVDSQGILTVYGFFDRDTFFASIHRAVVLGNPGAGKSTMAIKLCYDLAKNEAQRLFAGRQTLTPILVTLRVYGADKQKSKYSILDFIEGEAKKTFQLSAVPAQAFDYLLQTGRAMVIFDGLDELLDTSYRQIIRDDVELFCQLYPSVPVLVTSREVGYEQAPLNKNLFEVFRLAPFDDKQIDEYVHKWFTIADVEDISLTRHQNLTENFLKDSKIVPDLRSNPLMLALLCTIYHQEGYIPRYRPDVYEKCAVMLFERWDKSRNIYDPPLPEEHMRPLLEYLAHWIYANTQLRAGITTTTLIKKAASYLHVELYEDQRKAELVAREFITFCTGRAWVFIDMGTRYDGENLYQFAHATFLEYFAASQLARSSRYSSALLKVLLPHIAKREWDVMAQLAFQIYNKQNTNAIDELLTVLVELSKVNTDRAGLNLLSFAVRCLQFIIPRPNTRRTIAEACVERCITWGNKALEMGASEENSFVSSDEAAPGIIFDDFSNLTDKNSETIANTLLELLTRYANSTNDNEAIIAFEIALFARGYSPDFEKTSDKIFEQCSNRIGQLYPESILLSQNGLWSSNLEVNELIELHGVKSLFNSSIYVISDAKIMPSVFDCFRYGYDTDFYLDVNVEVSKYDILEAVGNYLLSYPSPWIKNQEIQLFIYEASRFFPEITKVLDLNSNALFGLFTLLIMITEVNKALTAISVSSHSLSDLEQQITSNILSEGSIHSVYLLLFARLSQNLHSYVQGWLDECNFSVEQQDFIWRWIRKEISLVAPDETNQDDHQVQPSSVPQLP